MYRSMEVYNKVNDEPLKYPVCIPSYYRPNNPFIEWVQKPGFDVPKENLFMFIRNTPEQVEMYKHLRKWVNLVLIPATTKDLGETRACIVKWGAKHNHDVVFMLDDRINGLWWNTVVNRKGVDYLDTVKGCTPGQAFKVWGQEHLDAGLYLSGVSYKGFHWSSSFVNLPNEPLARGGGPGGCVAFSPKKMLDAGINYKSNFQYGPEDLYILYQILINRLPYAMLTDICCGISNAQVTGGDSAVQPGLSRDERLLELKKTFWQNVLGIPWGTKHPGFRVRKSINEDNLVGINLPYWRKYYADTK